MVEDDAALHRYVNAFVEPIGCAWKRWLPAGYPSELAIIEAYRTG
jgi:hypothetical protein